MENAETLTEVEIPEFLKGRHGMVFEGETRGEERYLFVQRVIVAQQHAVQNQKRDRATRLQP